MQSGEGCLSRAATRYILFRWDAVDTAKVTILNMGTSIIALLGRIRGFDINILEYKVIAGSFSRAFDACHFKTSFAVGISCDILEKHVFDLDQRGIITALRFLDIEIALVDGNRMIYYGGKCYKSFVKPLPSPHGLVYVPELVTLKSIYDTFSTRPSAPRAH